MIAPASGERGDRVSTLAPGGRRNRSGESSSSGRNSATTDVKTMPSTSACVLTVSRVSLSNHCVTWTSTPSRELTPASRQAGWPFTSSSPTSHVQAPISTGRTKDRIGF